jgi:hypothetical protein
LSGLIVSLIYPTDFKFTFQKGRHFPSEPMALPPQHINQLKQDGCILLPVDKEASDSFEELKQMIILQETGKFWEVLKETNPVSYRNVDFCPKFDVCRYQIILIPLLIGGFEYSGIRGLLFNPVILFIFLLWIVKKFLGVECMSNESFANNNRRSQFDLESNYHSPHFFPAILTGFNATLEAEVRKILKN